MTDDELRNAMHVAVERDGAAAPAFAEVVAATPRARRVRWVRAGVLALGAALAVIVLLPRSSPPPVAAAAPIERDPLLASATGSLLLDGTPDFTSSFALAREIASY